MLLSPKQTHLSFYEIYAPDNILLQVGFSPNMKSQPHSNTEPLLENLQYGCFMFVQGGLTI